jgi:hypothetical protein
VAFLISRTDYKTWAGITGTAQDTVLDLLLGYASAMIRTACERNNTNGFESTARTEYYNGADVYTLLLRERPITVLTSVGWLDDTGTETLLESTEYTYDADAGIVALQNAGTNRFTGGTWGMAGGWNTGLYSDTAGYGGWVESPSFANGTRNYKVVYTAGYATIPPDLQMACARVVDLLNSQRATDPSKTSESLGQYSYTRSMMVNSKTGDLMGPLESVKTILSPYMNFGGAR